jgi:predicted phosphodiesterase
MRYLVFSDIHGNLDALESITEEIDIIRPDMVVSLGDVVGYGASPRECIDLVEACAHIKIGGNHDLAAVGLTDSNDFNPTARQAIQWTEEMLDPARKDALERYDTIKRYSRCLFAHATPVAPLSWDYIYTVAQARKVFERHMEKYIFIGHTHVPGIIAYDPEHGCTVIRETAVQPVGDARYLINVGSVGQPRDGIAAASFALLDTKRGKITLRRIPYDVRSAQERIRAVGLPEALASRLATAT